MPVRVRRSFRVPFANIPLDESTGRLLPPSQFIPYAEKSNLIIDIDRWMLNAVIEHLAADPDMAPIAVNLSGRSVNEPTIADFIALQLMERHVDPARLFIEITETAAISDMRDAQRFIERLHAIGCKVALDDFGAGFATFAYIKQLPVDVLKIDGLFVRDIGSRGHAAIARTTSGMEVRSLSYTVLVATYVFFSRCWPPVKGPVS